MFDAGKLGFMPTKTPHISCCSTRPTASKRQLTDVRVREVGDELIVEATGHHQTLPEGKERAQLHLVHYPSQRQSDSLSRLYESVTAKRALTAEMVLGNTAVKVEDEYRRKRPESDSILGERTRLFQPRTRH
jgi:hypothetical protein